MHSFRKSILKLSLFSIVPLLVIGYAIFLTGEHTDDFYKRFTSSPQHSLILGSSRGSGINPAILDKIIQPKYPKVKFYNYAFTWGHSPYGPKYLESIRKKLDPKTKDGIFVVIVEPTALMVTCSKPDSPEYYFENDKAVAKTTFVNVNPNLEYLIESYDYSLTRALNLKILPPKNPMADVEVLDNGKMEVKMIKDYSPEKRAEENTRKMGEFQKRIDDLKWSEKRLKYLEETIRFLQKHGKVLLLRMPVNSVPYQIEDNAVPFFDAKIQELSIKYKVNYTNYNLTPNDYKCIDEVHLSNQSMTEFSKKLGQKIISE
ncbi:hypothetical protein [Kaistella jeonii]|uniref:Uncharacterized protein n=1 Tax=Kaistella jeonii TaxID=266749 RepID=A0A0C1F9V4_9FLAO|nr:hypothetical protein [Kaistella jeonii]KIA89932.1 hypothetical protein OA86_04830 [Kaistella jeonii]SFB80797.1 hypothetical protein SAMN05421876_102331 [Kaistella jeonii]VEI96185.1 Uncharacterised protein [Kaistella jeonii]